MSAEKVVGSRYEVDAGLGACGFRVCVFGGV
jgi:hypothetical protein